MTDWTRVHEGGESPDLGAHPRSLSTNRLVPGLHFSSPSAHPAHSARHSFSASFGLFSRLFCPRSSVENSRPLASSTSSGPAVVFFTTCQGRLLLFSRPFSYLSPISSFSALPVYLRFSLSDLSSSHLSSLWASRPSSCPLLLSLSCFPAAAPVITALSSRPAPVDHYRVHANPLLASGFILSSSRFS